MPDADRDLLLNAVRQAGVLALALQAKGYGHKQKRDGTFVTDVDQAVDDFLKSLIASARPEDGWLSEETPDSAVRLARSRLWIVDPIDGTKGFLQGSGPWGIGMALVENGIVQCAAVFRPTDDLLIHAALGQGAFRNGVRLSGLMAARGVITPKRFAAGLAQRHFKPELNSPVPLLLRLADIACGDIIGAISTGQKNDWDIAAGHLLVTEMGGVITRQDGSPVVYNQPEPWQPGLIAAADAKSHAAILEAVRGSA